MRKLAQFPDMFTVRNEPKQYYIIAKVSQCFNLLENIIPRFHPLVMAFITEGE